MDEFDVVVDIVGSLNFQDGFIVHGIGDGLGRDDVDDVSKNGMLTARDHLQEVASLLDVEHLGHVDGGQRY